MRFVTCLGIVLATLTVAAANEPPTLPKTTTSKAPQQPPRFEFVPAPAREQKPQTAFETPPGSVRLPKRPAGSSSANSTERSDLHLQVSPIELDSLLHPARAPQIVHWRAEGVTSAPEVSNRILLNIKVHEINLKDLRAAGTDFRLPPSNDGPKILDGSLTGAFIKLLITSNFCKVIAAPTLAIQSGRTGTFSCNSVALSVTATNEGSLIRCKISSKTGSVDAKVAPGQTVLSLGEVINGKRTVITLTPHRVNPIQSPVRNATNVISPNPHTDDESLAYHVEDCGINRRRPNLLTVSNETPIRTPAQSGHPSNSGSFDSVREFSEAIKHLELAAERFEHTGMPKHLEMAREIRTARIDLIREQIEFHKSQVTGYEKLLSDVQSVPPSPNSVEKFDSPGRRIPAANAHPWGYPKPSPSTSSSAGYTIPRTSYQLTSPRNYVEASNQFKYAEPWRPIRVVSQVPPVSNPGPFATGLGAIAGVLEAPADGNSLTRIAAEIRHAPESVRKAVSIKYRIIEGKSSVIAELTTKTRFTEIAQTAHTPDVAVRPIGNRFESSQLAVWEKQLAKLQKANAVRILTSSTVVAFPDRFVRCHSGGHIAVPVMTNGTMSIQQRPFGVTLNLKASPMEDKSIKLDVNRTFSRLSYQNAPLHDGVPIPAITERRLQTSVFVPPGETIVIDGQSENGTTTILVLSAELVDRPLNRTGSTD